MTQQELYNANKHKTSHDGNVGAGNVGVGTSTPPPPPPPPAPEPTPEPDPTPSGPIISDDRDEADAGEVK